LGKEILSSYDRILDLGHLCLYRNTEKVNRYFMLEAPGVPFYKQVFQQGIEMAFDEWQGIYRIFRYHNIPQYHADVIVDVIPPTRWKFPRFEGVGIKNYFSADLLLVQRQGVSMLSQRGGCSYRCRVCLHSFPEKA